MSRGAAVVIIIFIVVGFIFASQAIVRVKSAELSFQLEREQLFNYELSSRMLRVRFRTMLEQRDDFKKEVRMNVLESGVLNFSDEARKFSLGWMENSGLFIVNLVRIAALKRWMTLREDQGDLLLLQYAFFMERSRDFAKAVKKYEELEKRLEQGQPNDHGFVLLHGGFCLAMLGRTADAIAKLEFLINKYPGSRNANDAAVLLQILREAKERTDEIEKRFHTEVERAVALYQSGQYAASLKEFKKVKNLSTPQKYGRARSLEGVGRTKEAVKEYMKLVGQTKDQKVAKQANRRLLMIGTFYRGGKEVKKVAEANAKKIGDEEVVKEIKRGEALRLKPEVIEKIKKQSQLAAAGPGNDKKEKVVLDEDTLAMARELANDIKKLEKEDKKFKKAVKKQVKVAVIKTPVVKKRRPKPKPVIRIQLTLVDGRPLFGDRISVDEDGLQLSIGMGDLDNNVPYYMVERIEIEQSNDLKKSKNKYILEVRLNKEKMKNEVVKVDSIIRTFSLKRSGDEILILIPGKEPIRVKDEYLLGVNLIKL